jgi:hypothetical protein
MSWWNEWLDIKSMRTLSQHASAILTAVVLFTLIALALKLIPLPDAVRYVLEGMEDLGLTGLFGWFFWQMALVLWKGRVRNGNLLLAA